MKKHLLMNLGHADAFQVFTNKKTSKTSHVWNAVKIVTNVLHSTLAQAAQRITPN
jgi:hypothetical protein